MCVCVHMCVCAHSLGHVQLCHPTDCTLPGSSMGLPRQEYWRGLQFLFQRIFLTQWSNPYLLHWQADSETPGRQINTYMKEESEKAGLKLNLQKTKIVASSPIPSWQINGEKVETVTDFIFLSSKITADVTAAMKLKDAYSLEGKLWQI